MELLFWNVPEAAEIKLAVMGCPPAVANEVRQTLETEPSEFSVRATEQRVVLVSPSMKFTVPCGTVVPDLRKFTTAVNVTCWLTSELIGAEVKVTEVPDAPTCCVIGSDALLPKAGSVLVKLATTLKEPGALKV